MRLPAPPGALLALLALLAAHPRPAAAATASPSPSPSAPDLLFDQCRSLAELDTAVKYRASYGYEYFPNVAVGADVSLSTLGLAAGGAAAEIVDGDRCCEAFAATGGECGLAFPPGQGAVQATVVLAAPAFVNSAVITWRDPCNQEPRPGFVIEAIDLETGEWATVTSRVFTGSDTTLPCEVFAGESGAISFCIDYFPSFVHSDTFRLAFNNTLMDLGGWMYEFEVHGIAEGAAYTVAPLGGQITLDSETSTALPDLVVRIEDFSGLPANDDGVARNVSCSLALSSEFATSSSSDQDAATVAALLSGVPDDGFSVVYSDAAGALVAVLSGLSLESPPANNYTLVLTTSDGLASGAQELRLVAGPPARLLVEAAADDAALSTIADVQSALPALRVAVLDAGGIEVPVPAGFSLTVVLSAEQTLSVGANYTTPVTAVVPSGSSDAVVSGLWVAAPPTGTLEVVASSLSGGLADAQLGIEVFPGSAAAISVPLDAIEVAAAAVVVLPEVVAQVTDVGGTPLTSVSITPRIEATLESQASILSGTLEQRAVAGVAEFVDIELLAPATGVYTLVLRADSLDATTRVNVTVVAGEAAKLAPVDAEAAMSLTSTFQSDAVVVLQPLEVQILDGGGNEPTSIGYRVIAASITQADGTPVGGGMELFGNITQITSTGVAVFDFLAVSQPPQGDYVVVFSDALTGDLEPYQWPFSIVPGAATQLCVIEGTEHDSSAAFSACAQTVVTISLVESILSLGVVFFDAGGAATTVDSLGVNRTVTAEAVSEGSSLGASNATATASYVLDEHPVDAAATGYEVRVAFDNLYLASPAAGTHQISFSSPGLEGWVLDVEILVGPASQIAIAGGDLAALRSAASTDLPAIEGQVQDAGGSWLQSFSEASVDVALQQGAAGAPELVQNQVTALRILDGLLSIPASVFSLSSPAAGEYVLEISARSVSVALALTVEPGDAVSVAVDRYETDSSELPSTDTVMVGNVTLVSSDAGGNAASPGFTGYVTAVWESTGEVATLNADRYRMVDGVLDLYDLYLRAPTVGVHRVLFVPSAVSGLVETSLDVTIVSGPAARLLASYQSLTVTAAATVELPPVLVNVSDAGGNVVADTAANDTAVAPVFVVLATEATETLLILGRRETAVGGVALFSRLELVAPPSGAYTLTFGRDGGNEELQAFDMTLIVGPGEPVVLEVQNADNVLDDDGRLALTSSNTPREALEIVVRDTVGNNAEFDLQESLIEAVVLDCDECELSGVDFVFVGQDGVAVFSDLEFLGTRGEVYTIRLMLVGTTVTLDLEVQVAECHINAEASEASVGQCVCSAGFYSLDGGCFLCPAGTYKADASNQNFCNQCGANKGTPDVETGLATTGSDSEDDCICGEGFYRSTEPDESGELPCLSCPATGAICTKTSNEIVAARGYWLLDDTDNIFRCPLFDACDGTLEGGCINGHTGPLCSLCEEGHGKVGNSCSSCPSDATNYTRIAFAFLAVWLLIFTFLKSANEASNASIRLKLFINYLQTTAFVGDFFIAWPTSFARYTGVASLGLINLQIQPIDCLSSSSVYAFFLWQVSIPVLIMVIIVVPYLVYTYRRYRPVRMAIKPARAMVEQSQSQRQRILSRFQLLRVRTILSRGDTVGNLVNSSIIVLYILHSTVTQAVFQMLNCRGDLNSALVEDMTVSCSTDEHRSYQIVAIVIGVLYPIGFPLAIFGLLYSLKVVRRINLHKPSVRYRFGFVYEGFQEDRWYWELVNMARRMVLLAISTFLFLYPILQAYFTAWLFTLALIMHTEARPLVGKVNARLEELSHFTMFFTVMGGLLIEAEYLNDDSSARVAVITTVMIMHAVLLLLFVYFLLAAYGFEFYKEWLRRRGVDPDADRSDKARTREGVATAAPIVPPRPVALPIDPGEIDLAFEGIERPAAVRTKFEKVAKRRDLKVKVEDVSGG